MYGCRYFSERAGFADPGSPDAGGFVRLAPSDQMAVYSAVLAGDFFALLLCLPWTILVTIATDGEFLATAIRVIFWPK